MSNQKRAALARRAAITLSVFALAALSLDTASAVTRTRFQQQVDLKCTVYGCTARFVDLPPTQALDIAHVWCDIEIYGTGSVIGSVDSATVFSYPLTVPSFEVPLELGWDRIRQAGNIGKVHHYTLKADPDMLVPYGGQFAAALSYSQGDPIGSCSVTGERLTK